MTPTERTVAHLRIAAETAVQHHAFRRARAEARTSHWLRQRDAYVAAAGALRSNDPRAHRALVLAEWAAHRALAWQALSRAEPVLTRAHLRHARRAWTAAHAIRIA